MSSLALTLNQLTSLYMFGVIWIIQLIHYPSFTFISPSDFSQFHARHTFVMGILVGPVMIVEFLAAAWLLSEQNNILTVANFCLVAALWLLTFLVSVPLHNKLADGIDFTVINSLIKTNWPRTLLWTAKALIASFWLMKAGST